MFIIFDIIICILLYILVILILCGYLSLCERKILALIQLRIGPGLFFFGLLTPITDGIKLFLKFSLFIVSIDIFYFISSCFILIYTLFIIWFIIPVGFIIFIDVSFTIFIISIVHVIFNIICVYAVGCFIFTSCFIYLASLRIIIFSIITEILLFLSLYSIYSLDFFCWFSIKDMCISQLYLINFFYLSYIFIFFFCIVILLDCLRLPFDYSECESELVAGIVTEFSGIFFILYSLSESNHIILNCLLLSALCLGGLFTSYKLVLILIIIILFPRSILCRFKVTDIINYISFYILIFFNLYFFWSLQIKLISISIF